MGPSKKLQEIIENMSEATFKRFEDLWWNNTVGNERYATHSILEAKVKRRNVDYSSALVIANGPSFARRRSLETLQRSTYSGLVIAVDSVVGTCLRNGIIPDCIVCVDPRPRIVHYFGADERLDRLRPEDVYYYQTRKDETHLGPEPVATSRSNKDLLNKYGEQMIALLSTSISPRIAQRCKEAGIESYWFNPMYDDYELPDSFTRKVYELNPVPCANVGGNVGTAAWIMAHSVFQIKKVALVGFDFSYYSDTPLEKTQYYDDLVKVAGLDGLDALLPRFVNPTTGEEFFTDPAYFWYRQVFLELAATAPCVTINCTEGGIVFGGSILEMALSNFLSKSQSKGE
jgi:hypothetical protein